MKPDSSILHWLPLAAVVIVAGCAGGTPPVEAPDAVFLIVVDTLRPDRLSCYGSDNATPNIDRIAQKGVLFSYAQSAASWTVPSMGAMMTSLYPTQLGLVEEPSPVTQTFPPRERRKQLAYTPPQGPETLAEMLSAAGYRTAAFVNQPFLNVKDGFLQGFDQWCHAINNKETVWHDTSQPIERIGYPPGTELGVADTLLVEQFAGWVAENADNKLFVWLHLLKPHWPYRPESRFMADYEGDWRKSPGYMRYDAEIRATDELIGRALAVIDAATGLDKSLVIFTSDHGESFGEHGGVEHGHSLHREVVHVPLIIAGPALPAGQVVYDTARTIDILPTIAAMTGKSAPAGIQGASLLPLIAGEPDSRTAFAEGMLYGGTERSILIGPHKLMYEAEGGERIRFYNVSADLYEDQDLSDQLQLRAADMRIRLENFYKELLARKDQRATNAEDEQILESLKALGYIGGD